MSVPGLCGNLLRICAEEGLNIKARHRIKGRALFYKHSLGNQQGFIKGKGEMAVDDAT
jgi:hypothetical protein